MSLTYVTVHPILASISTFTDIDASTWTVTGDAGIETGNDGLGYEFNSDLQPGNTGTDAYVIATTPPVTHSGTLVLVTVTVLNLVSGVHMAIETSLTGGGVLSYQFDDGGTFFPGVDATEAELLAGFTIRAFTAGEIPGSPGSTFLNGNGSGVDQIRVTYAFESAGPRPRLRTYPRDDKQGQPRRAIQSNVRAGWGGSFR